MALEPYILPQDQLRMDRPQVPAGIVNALLAETSKDMAHSLVLDGYDMQVTLDGNPPTSADIVWRDPKAAAINAGHSTDYARDMHHQFGDLYWCDLEPEVWWSDLSRQYLHLLEDSHLLIAAALCSRQDWQHCYSQDHS